MIAAIYNTIGKTYDTTRKPDPEIVQTLWQLLSPAPQGRYLDVACGSGNYTNALARKGLKIDGIDISDEMLSKARVKNPSLNWYQGDAASLIFPDKSYDGAICTLATHHMDDFPKAFGEVYRVLKPGSHFVILTATPEQMSHYWLAHYFPRMMQDAARRMAPFSHLEQAYLQAGFTHIRTTPFFVTESLTDWFLHAGKYRPSMYLDPSVRAGISSFHVSVDEDELTAGLALLAHDIDSGKINDIINDYESDGGEYLFVVGEKS